MILTKQLATNQCLYSDAEWEQHPLYHMVLYPFNLFHFIMAPIVIHDRVQACINIIRDIEHPFSNVERKCFGKLACYIACGIQKLYDPGYAELKNNITQQYLKKKGIFQNKAMAEMTSREKEVLCLVAEGLADRDIAKRLNISVYTVKDHLKRIYSKLEVSSRIQAITKAIGLVNRQM
jgi:DNA-binding CsgD family transcriptional regulator